MSIDNEMEPMGFYNKESGYIEWKPGISLLDHFAGLAMQAIVGKDFAYQAVSGTQQIACASYRIAEAMLAERERRAK